MSGSWYDNEPPDGLREGIMFVSPERREMLICPDCGDVTTVDAKLLASTVFNNLPPRACSQCGTAYLILQQQEVPA